MRIVEITSWQKPRQPRRPPDIIDFLISLGGVQDQGGELRAMDLHRAQRGRFGVLVRNPINLNAQRGVRIRKKQPGITPDHARESAEEAGYLRQGSTINDLLDAIQMTALGHPVYRPEEAAEWRDQHQMWRAADEEQRDREQQAEYWHPDNIFAGI